MRVGIKHIEFWVSDLKKSMTFYEKLFEIIGWKKVKFNSFKSGETKIYFKEVNVLKRDSLGPRHICFHAKNREDINNLGEFLRKGNFKLIRGPVEMTGKLYSKGYYTIDFYDPDMYILEVAYAPKK